MRLARLEGDAQRHAFAEQVLLADHLAQVRGPQASASGCVGGGNRLVRTRVSLERLVAPVYWRTTSAPAAA